MPRTGLLVTVVVLLVAGCSAGAPASAPTPEPTPSATVSSPSSAPASTTSCPDGAYLLTAFEGRGEASAAGTGSGGDITVDFTAGRFVIRSDGAQPVKLDLGPVNAELRFDGEINGTYEGDPSALALRTTGAHGTAAVKGFGVTRDYSVGGLADQLIGQGATAQVTCDDAAGTAQVTLPSASLTLTRAGR